MKGLLKNNTKYRLKKWVVVLILSVNCLLAFICSGESTDLTKEIIIKTPMFIFIVLSSLLVIKYGDLNRIDLGE